MMFVKYYFFMFFVFLFWIENWESLFDVVKSILVGNFFIYYKRFNDLNLEKYFIEIKDRN